MDVRTEELEPAEVAFVRCQGPSARSAKVAWETIWPWAQQHGLAGRVRQAVGFGHHNPNVTPAEQLVYDACLKIDGGFASEEPVRRQVVPGGRYAILTLKGPYAQIGAGFDRMRREWLPTCAEPTDWRPWIERYLNDPAQVPSRSCSPSFACHSPGRS